MIIEDTAFPGLNQRFAAETARRAVHAIACEASGAPWPGWSDREAVAVAIVLLDREVLRDAGFWTYPEAAKFVADGLEHPFSSEDEAREFFAAIRTRIEKERFTAAWGRSPL